MRHHLSVAYRFERIGPFGCRRELVSSEDRLAYMAQHPDYTADDLAHAFGLKSLSSIAVLRRRAKRQQAFTSK